MTDELAPDALDVAARADVAASTTAFEVTVEAVVRRLAPQHLRALAAGIAAGWPEHALRSAVPTSGFAEAVGALRASQREHGVSDAEAAAFLRGLVAGRAQRTEVRVESVWSGPDSHAVPVRATAPVLVELVHQATRELVFMTYSAKLYEPLREALAEAVGRGVRVDAVVETIAGAGGALAGAEPAAAFSGVDGVHLWHWPPERRPAGNAKMHAKLAVADREVLLVTSANLTQSGVGNNIEAGLLVYGGTAPQRVAEHVAELTAKGVLAPLRRRG